MHCSVGPPSYHLGVCDVRALPYGPRHTGPGFLIFLRARTSQNLARKADTLRHTGPIYFYVYFCPIYFYACHVLPNYTLNFIIWQHLT
jgi:hypothetical protein